MNASSQAPNAPAIGMHSAMETARIRVARPPAREPTVAGDSAGGVGSRSSEVPREGRAPPSARGLPDLHRRFERTSPRMSQRKSVEEVTGATCAQGLVPSFQPRSSIEQMLEEVSRWKFSK